MRIVRITVLVLGVLLAFWLRTASAKVMISEILWSGTDISTADEWVEIVGLGLGLGSGANTVADDLSGWLLTTRNSSGEDVPIIRFATGTVLASGAYLVISNYDAGGSRLAIAPDMVTTAVLLPNTKLQLKLYDASGTLIDVADDGIGVPMAGVNASGTGWRASMERMHSTCPATILLPGKRRVQPVVWIPARRCGEHPDSPTDLVQEHSL
ncbi:MAG: lamin tail domain-containing protein, partial [Candidatus Peribacteraceae bacterium]